MVIFKDAHPVLSVAFRISLCYFIHLTCPPHEDLIRVIKSAGPHKREDHAQSVPAVVLFSLTAIPHEWHVHLAERGKEEMHNGLDRGIKRDVSALRRANTYAARREGAGGAKAW